MQDHDHDHDHDRPHGDEGFTDPRRHGWIATVAIAVFRSVAAVVTASRGGQYPVQRPLDAPGRNRDHRP